MTKLFQPRFVVIGPDPFSYVDQGSGPPVLFLHGALGDLRTWLPHIQAVSAQFRCIAYTQRYFGTQSWRNNGPPFGVATHADDLIALVEALGLTPVSLVGWSYTGHVALHAALQRPDLFAAFFMSPVSARSRWMPTSTTSSPRMLRQHSAPSSRRSDKAISSRPRAC